MALLKKKETTRKIQEGEMVWSSYFNDWIKVLRIDKDGFFWFASKGEVLKSQSLISHFESTEKIPE